MVEGEGVGVRVADWEGGGEGEGGAEGAGVAVPPRTRREAVEGAEAEGSGVKYGDLDWAPLPHALSEAVAALVDVGAAPEGVAELVAGTEGVPKVVGGSVGAPDAVAVG